MKSVIFDIKEDRVKGRKDNIDYFIEVSQRLIKKKFSPSFVEWLKKYGEEVHINRGEGNFITDKLIPRNEKEEIISICNGAEALKKAGWPINNDFIPFGNDGGDNIFAFYTKFSKDGEYPVFMISLHDEKKPYVLMGKSFKSFVNTYVKSEILRPDVSEEELLKITTKAVKKNEPNLEINFASQLVDWNWTFYSINLIEKKLKDMGFKISEGIKYR